MNQEPISKFVGGPQDGLLMNCGLRQSYDFPVFPLRKIIGQTEADAINIPKICVDHYKRIGICKMKYHEPRN